MDQGLLQASIALGRGFRSVELHAANIANAATPGYRKLVPAHRTFRNHLDRALHGNRPFAYVEERRVFGPGQIRQTGNRLDVALEGPGFFAVQANGETLYTRAGTFSMSPDGILVTQEGWSVLSRSGPVRLNPRGGPITVAEDGSVLQDSITVGKIRIVEFDAPYPLEDAGAVYFRGRLGHLPREAARTHARQGYRELSNVNMMEEMVELIGTMRRFEAAQRTIRTIDRTMQQLIEAHNR